MNYWRMVKLFHVVFNGPYVYYIHTLNNTDNKYKKIHYMILGLIGLILILRTIQKHYNKKSYKWLYVHGLIFGPLFIYIYHLSLTKKKIPRFYNQLLKAIGIAAFGYHLTSFLK